jgi:hypothetical protein
VAIFPKAHEHTVWKQEKVGEKHLGKDRAEKRKDNNSQYNQLKKNNEPVQPEGLACTPEQN